MRLTGQSAVKEYHGETLFVKTQITVHFTVQVSHHFRPEENLEKMKLNEPKAYIRKADISGGRRTYSGL